MLETINSSLTFPDTHLEIKKNYNLIKTATTIKPKELLKSTTDFLKMALRVINTSRSKIMNSLKPNSLVDQYILKYLLFSLIGLMKKKSVYIYIYIYIYINIFTGQRLLETINSSLTFPDTHLEIKKNYNLTKTATTIKPKELLK